MNTTQLRAQKAICGLIVKQAGMFPAGASVSLVWMRSYLDTDSIVVNDLRHEYLATGFGVGHRFITQSVTDLALDQIVFSDAK